MSERLSTKLSLGELVNEGKTKALITGASATDRTWVILFDAARGRTLQTEVWYPADESARGLPPATAESYLPPELGFLADNATIPLVAVRDEVVFCERCFNISDQAVCPICRDPARDARRICVVEEPLDVLAIERTGGFHGLYHVLHGVISPSDGVGPEDLKIGELLARLRDLEPGVTEIIVATNPNLEGEATAMYLAERLTGRVGSVTRIARGIPVGGDLEYADEVTLVRALQGRRSLDAEREAPQ